MNEFMEEALNQAKKARKIGEVPIGAVIVKNGKIISRAYNKRESSKIATAHAEILAIEKACKKLNSWRLDGAEIYVNLEPCLMCYGAIINARISKLYFGLSDDKVDEQAINKSLLCHAKHNGLNHTLQVFPNVMEEECKAKLAEFFREIRNVKRY